MINSAANSDYPKFVADQVLTSDNLNDLFGYLDEQGRLTRANLSGIGIVCGLEIVAAADGSSIKITKGVGITSSGYLVTMPEVTYTERTVEIFDAVKSQYYNKFINVSDPSQKFDLWELKQEAESEGTTALTKSFLTDGDKIVLIFVELLEENNKNCDPNSCDDKGTQVTVTFRPLLVKKSDAATLISSAGSETLTAADFNELPDLVMPRWNILNSSPVHADEIIKAYQDLLTAPFIANVQNILSTSWQTFQPVIGQEYPTDPFATYNLVSKFAFLHNGTIGNNESRHIQYYYDLFSDLAAAYNEFCLAGNEIISECSPDSTLFPRHLLLGEAIPSDYVSKSEYRHYFIYSPLFQRKELLVELKFLFRRMVLMLNSFSLPPVTSSSPDDKKIIFTPSLLSNYLISEKAIPYYFKPDSSPRPLYQNWSFYKSKRNRAKQNLSYHASVYATDDFVKNPLNYDLESYNFFRLEGIIGKNVMEVTETIKKRLTDYRLPVKLIALATGEPGSGSQDDNCCFLPNLQLQFRLLRKELLSCLESNIKYWGSIQKKKDSTGKLVFRIKDLPLAYMGDYVPVYGATKGLAIQSEPLMMKAKEETIEGMSAASTANTEHIRRTSEETSGKTTARIISADVAKESTRSFKWNDVQEVGKDTIASVYLDYQKIENIHMAGLPRPRTSNTVENIQYYVLILIDEMESLTNLLDSENVSDFDIESYNRHVATLNNACIRFSDLLTSYKKTDYLVETMRVTLEGHAETINQIAEIMPVMNDDDASKIKLLLANIENVNAFTTELRQNEGDYQAQQGTINSFYNKLDKDGMMVPVTKNPDTSFVSGYTPMLERLKSCKCNGIMDKIVLLVEKYRSQLDKLRDINNFSVYTKEHPGIQHKAGVPNGGTFIVVYKGPNDRSEKIPLNTVIADFYLPYNCCSNCNPIEVTFQEAPPPENQPPVARPGDNISIRLPEDSVTLDGSTSSDPDGTIKSYLWELESGPEADIKKPEESIITVSGLSEGSYVFKLTVTDDDGATHSDKVTVTVLSTQNEPPKAVAFANPTTVVLSANGQGTTQLSGEESTDPDGEIKKYEWSLSTGPEDGADIKKSDEVQTQVTFRKTGTYIFKLIVTDNDGATDSTVVNVSVVRENLPPVAKAVANPASLIVTSGQPVTAKLEGSGSSDPDGNIKSYKWKLAGNTPGAIIEKPDEANTSVQFSQPGNFSFQLTVTDEAGLSNTASASIRVTQENIESKACASLNKIVSDFEKISEADNADTVKAFTDTYSDFKRIARFFVLMKRTDVMNMTVDDQVKFFIEQRIELQLRSWIENLSSILLDSREFRTLSLLTFTSLIELAYYISCIQDQDIDKAKVKMNDVISIVNEILQRISPQVGNFATEHKRLISQLATVSNNERKRLKNNGEENKKPLYTEMLSAILNVFRSMNL
jgi:hypothetical protein